MIEWGWAIAAAVLGITLVQLVAYYYLMREDSGTDIWPTSTDAPGTGRGSASAPGSNTSESRFDGSPTEKDARRCNRCGAPNDSDPLYTYCYNCCAQLS